MNILKRSTAVVAGLALTALAASQVQAAVGNCRNGNRAFPAGTQEIIFKCRHSNGPTTVATLGAKTELGVKKLTALLTAGPAGVTATSFGVDAAGSAIPGCRADDTSTAGTTPVTVSCAAAAQWRAQITFQE